MESDIQTIKQIAAVLFGFLFIAIGMFAGFIIIKLPSIFDGFNVFNGDWDNLMEDYEINE